MSKERDEAVEVVHRILNNTDRIAEKFERYVDEKIEIDKVLIGILNDMNLRQEMESTMARENENQGITAKTEATPAEADAVSERISGLTKSIAGLLLRMDTAEKRLEELPEDRRLN